MAADPHPPIATRLTDQRHRATHPLQLALALVGLALLAFTLFRFPPSQYTFYPRCPIETLLHIQCPGCGTTRALAALLHGHLGQALRLNALTTCALPAAASCFLYRSVRSLLGRPLPALVIAPFTLSASFVALALFTLVRNL